MVWEFKREEGNSQEDEKEQAFAELMFALLQRDNGSRGGGILSNRLLGPSVSVQLVPVAWRVSAVAAPFRTEILRLNSSRKLGEGQRFLSLWGLTCFQLTVIGRSERHIWGWQILLPFPSTAATQCRQLFTSRWWLGLPGNVNLAFEQRSILASLTPSVTQEVLLVTVFFPTLIFPHLSVTDK